METFNWRVTTDSSGGGDFKVNKSDFGDGYSQRAPIGLNNERQEWSVTYTGTTPGIDAVLDFVRRHRGATPFLWTPPRSPQGAFVCTGHRITDHGGHWQSLVLTFEQVYVP